MTNLERRMQHKRLQWLCTKNSQRHSQTVGKDMLNKCDFRCVLKVENVQDRHRSDCSKHVDWRRQEHGRQWLSTIASSEKRYVILVAPMVWCHCSQCHNMADITRTLYILVIYLITWQSSNKDIISYIGTGKYPNIKQLLLLTGYVSASVSWFICNRYIQNTTDEFSGNFWKTYAKKTD